MQSKSYFLGIDGGGSGTRAVIIDSARQVVGRGQGGPANHYSVGAAIAAQNCDEAACNAILDAQSLEPQFQSRQIVAWGFGLAGVGRETDRELMRHFLAEVCALPFALETDVFAAQAGAFAGEAGIVVSAGTGAIVFGVDEQNNQFRADGWGPLLGDEGSGYWIGMEALRTTCRSLDGRHFSPRFAAQVLEFLEVRDVQELVRAVYSPAFERAKIAALARLVFRLADEGDADAALIRTHAAQHLAQSIKAVARQMLQNHLKRSMNGEREIGLMNLEIALRGGLFEDQWLRASVGFAITELMVELKRDYLPVGYWRVVKPQFDAAVGAAILAQKLDL